ncbi:NtaA/DmoA family FMN-dependent monooxygenase [Paracoccus aminophilus]|uniref:Nitrilotriacetate monooxygenase family FMN-dependent n=1 Tax=Paracoccus aminophilus JCM 7686 TaxID=1367847 RepID=S5XSF5_PARAH|nr:NtaA/DmoA family FMN-dependent monooxygenase [Paracoccus aminophilus]AGT10384.1 nitrilotriacetate monooxygenase family FMN-dependent [Paracoccus aminophilus JCM 7686]
MAPRRTLCIGMALAPTWLRGEGWRRPDSNIEGLFSSDFALDIARRAEAVHLDFVFRPDTLSLPLGMLEQSFGFTSLDSTLLMASIARETSHIGLVTTISTMLQQPYIVARQMMSLHWLSNGRAGWNVVTAMQGQENFGMEDLPKSEDRYARAAEFTEVVLKLWDSFPAEAVLMDREAGRYADTALIRPIDHEGPHFRVKGPLNLPARPGPRIPLMQAGASSSGRDFAAGAVDMVFAPTPDIEAAQALRRDLRARAEAHGRDPDAIRLLPGLGLYLAPTRAEAEELFRAVHLRVDRASRIAQLRDWLGVDFSAWPDERVVTLADLPEQANPKSRTHAELLRRVISRQELSLAALLERPEVLSAAHWHVIGTVEDAVAEIRRWSEAGAIDGFVIASGGSVQSMHLALDALIPRLAEEGLFRKAYDGATFADHLGLTEPKGDPSAESGTEAAP